MGARKGTVHTEMTVARRALSFHHTMMERRRLQVQEQLKVDRAHLAELQRRIAQLESEDQLREMIARQRAIEAAEALEAAQEAAQAQA